MSSALSRRFSIVGVAVIGVLLTAGLLWSRLDEWSADRDHDDAQRLWESREPTAYSFDYTACSGMCEPCHARITVTSGEVTDVTGDGGCQDLDRGSAPTIETIFAMEEEGRSGPMTDSFEIDYSVTGFQESGESGVGVTRIGSSGQRE